MHLKRLITLSFLFTAFNLYAVEGMWLPILLEKYNIEEMQELGFKLKAEDIYDINNACLKDAVVGLVRLNNPFHHYCTGEVISNQGLVLTNHHCAMGSIQSHSTIENDYLTHGFWAMTQKEELSNIGLGMSFLKRIEDVTEKVLANIPENADTYIRDSIITSNIAVIEKEAVSGTHYLAKIKPFFSGNQYYLSVCEIFRDIRLVGAPPSSIGKFGGDTDNWMWPRHTGDFSMFRIYADSVNKPADYSPENVPYTPIRFLEISLDGINKDDFTMIMGFPGSTTEYWPSQAVALQTENINPICIKIRTQGLQIMKTEMDASPEVRIKYADKAAGMANGWKKWIGENRGLNRMDAISKKMQLEKDFTLWVNENEKRKTEYGNLLNDYSRLYTDITPFEIADNYYYEIFYGLELLRFSADFAKLLEPENRTDTAKLNTQLISLKIKTEKFFKNFHLATDKKLFAAFIEIYFNEMPKESHPELLELISTKFNGNMVEFTDYIYAKSMFPYPEKVLAFIENYKYSNNKKIANDPIFQLFIQATDYYQTQILPSLSSLSIEIKNINRLYMKGLIEYNSNKTLFPDANSTFRISYGKVDNYKPMDGVSYSHQTTLKGIIEKDNPDIYDYDVPDKLKELYRTNNFGNYANSDGTMPVCFTASNHTTGGNSGSPVLNGNGKLIGINFDRNWEGTMSDIMYDPDMCRNIALDIRYILFIIDKYAGAGYLLEEMKLEQTIK